MSPYAPECGPVPPPDPLNPFLRRIPAQVDPAAFIRYALRDPQGKPVELAVAHEELQAFLSEHRMALVELPRDHGKSFQVCGRVLWELGRDPGLRVKIVCATDAVAAERTRFLRDAVARNLWVRDAFPHLRPGDLWRDDAFTIQRPANVIGPSVAAFGVGAGSTGTRADLLVCDDLVDVRSLRSKAERDRVASYFAHNLMNLLEPDGRCWCLCTPWHADDLNARLKSNPAFAVLRRPVGEDFEPVWPEKWPPPALRERKEQIGSASFARGYLLRTMASEDAPIRPEWVRFWSEPVEAEMVVLSVDPAVSLSAHADRSALVVLGRVGGEVTGLWGGEKPQPPGRRAVEIRVLACAARRVAAPELVSLIEAFDRQWNPAVILFESNAAFLGVKDLLVRHAAFGPRIKGVSQSADKASRVAAFSVAVENGSFRLKGDATGSADAAQRELLEEMTSFPFGEHDDLLDAAATGCAYLLDRREPRVW